MSITKGRYAPILAGALLVIIISAAIGLFIYDNMPRTRLSSAAQPKITEHEAIKIAMAQYPNIKMMNATAELHAIDQNGNNPRLAWTVDLYVSPYIAIINATDEKATVEPPGTSGTLFGYVTIDATTGSIIDKDTVV